MRGRFERPRAADADADADAGGLSTSSRPASEGSSRRPFDDPRGLRAPLPCARPWQPRGLGRSSSGESARPGWVHIHVPRMRWHSDVRRMVRHPESPFALEVRDVRGRKLRMAAQLAGVLEAMLAHGPFQLPLVSMSAVRDEQANGRAPLYFASSAALSRGDEALRAQQQQWERRIDPPELTALSQKEFLARQEPSFSSLPMIRLRSGAWCLLLQKSPSGAVQWEGQQRNLKVDLFRGLRRQDVSGEDERESGVEACVRSLWLESAHLLRLDETDLRAEQRVDLGPKWARGHVFVFAAEGDVQAAAEAMAMARSSHATEDAKSGGSSSSAMPSLGSLFHAHRATLLQRLLDGDVPAGIDADVRVAELLKIEDIWLCPLSELIDQVITKFEAAKATLPPSLRDGPRPPGSWRGRDTGRGGRADFGSSNWRARSNQTEERRGEEKKDEQEASQEADN